MIRAYKVGVSGADCLQVEPGEAEQNTLYLESISCGSEFFYDRVDIGSCFEVSRGIVGPGYGGSVVQYF